MSSAPTEDECSICEYLLKYNEETVTTDCDHTFHLVCAQKRVDEKHKNDCRTCGKKLALANALKKHQATIITPQSDDEKYDQAVTHVCLLQFPDIF
jgi:hypothetical protein